MKEIIIKLLSIDAWRDSDGGWFWNNWHKAGEVPLSTVNLTPRRLFAFLRKEGYLSKESAGKVAIEDDQYNLVIVAKGTREPLFALEYGAVQ